MQWSNDLVQGVHSDSVLGDVDSEDVLSHNFSQITWYPSRGQAVHQRLPKPPCCLEFGEPAWLQKVLVCFCRLAEQ